jgi:hypothetical protein
MLFAAADERRVQDFGYFSKGKAPTRINPERGVHLSLTELTTRSSPENGIKLRIYPR